MDTIKGCRNLSITRPSSSGVSAAERADELPPRVQTCAVRTGSTTVTQMPTQFKVNVTLDFRGQDGKWIIGDEARSD